MQSGSFRLDIDPLTGQLRYYDLLGSPDKAEQTEVTLPEIEYVTDVSMVGNVFINEKIVEVMKNIGLFFTATASFILFLDELFGHKIIWTAVITGTETVFQLIRKIVNEVRKYKIHIEKVEEEKQEEKFPPEEIPEEEMNRVDEIDPMSDEDADPPQLADLVTDDGFVIATVEIPGDRNYEDLLPPTQELPPEPEIPSIPDEQSEPIEDWTEPPKEEETPPETEPQEKQPATRTRLGTYNFVWMQ